jgi:hypothetical protein
MEVSHTHYEGMKESPLEEQGMSIHLTHPLLPEKDLPCFSLPNCQNRDLPPSLLPQL